MEKKSGEYPSNKPLSFDFQLATTAVSVAVDSARTTFEMIPLRPLNHWSQLVVALNSLCPRSLAHISAFSIIKGPLIGIALCRAIKTSCTVLHHYPSMLLHEYTSYCRWSSPLQFYFCSSRMWTVSSCRIFFFTNFCL